MSFINSLPPLVDGVCGRIFCQANWLTPSYSSREQYGFCEQPQSGQPMRSRHTLHGLQQYGKSSDVTILKEKYCCCKLVTLT
jgi:hypothetical protein